MAQAGAQAGCGRIAGAGMRTARPGMTLIEVLVVLVIIGILATLTITVATRVSGAGKGRVTQDAIRILDQTLSSYVAAKEANPPAVLRDPREPSGRRLIPVADARNIGAPTNDQSILNSGGFFVYQAQNAAGLGGLLAGVDKRLFTKFDADSTENQFLTPEGAVNTNIDQFAAAGSPGGPSGQPQLTNQPEIPTVLDGWGRPIRYVHPTFGGVLSGSRLAPPAGVADQEVDLNGVEWQDLRPANSGDEWSFRLIRRNDSKIGGREADSDGGRPIGNRPYFYSAGPDGDASTLDDNLYSVRPEFGPK